MDRLKIGMIGCGAVTEVFYLPVLAAGKDFALTALADKNLERAQELAGRTGVRHVSGNYQDILDKVDAVVIALPNALHADITVDCLNRGVHTLVEKPMAVTAAECDAMITAAQNRGRTLAVGHSKRFFHVNRFVKDILAEKTFGDLESIDIRDGAVFKWPIASKNFFTPQAACGLLLDSGAHVLDLMLWWCGDYRKVDYFDDAQGGVEADCTLRLEFHNGASGIVEMSRTRDLRRTYIITTQRARIEVEAGWQQPWIRITAGNRLVLDGTVDSEDFPQATYNDVLLDQLADFAAAIREGRPAYVHGEEARRCVALMEECQRNRRLLPQPWVTVPGKEAAHV